MTQPIVPKIGIEAQQWAGNGESDYVEPFLAYRLWRVRRAGSKRNVLVSTSGVDASWPIGETMVATCHADNWGKPRCRLWAPPPNANCETGCGIYGLKEPGEEGLKGLRSYYGRRVYVEYELLIAGTVKLWGRVLEGQLGYRAEFAYPHAFALFTYAHHNDLVRAVASVYGVPALPEKELLSGGVIKMGQMMPT